MYKIFLLPFIILLSCSSSKTNNSLPVQQEKNIQRLQNMKFDTYTEMWQQVDKLDKKGMTRSAYELTQKIYQKAKKENNSPQIIKSLLYQSRYMMVLEENSRLKIVRNFKKEINESTPPTSNILENYLAQLYWQYYQNNRWRFARRTETGVQIDTTDFRTWDLKTIFKEINRHFDRSLQNKTLLQKLSVDKWEPILQIHKETRKYRPTLYDLLAHEALRFYQSDENGLPAPAYKFEIDNPAFLSDARKFITINIHPQDSLSPQVKAIQLYQDLLQFRLQYKQLDALAMVDLERLSFVYRHAVFADKDKAYIQTLSRFIHDYEESDVAALAYYHLAKYLTKQGDQYPENHNENVRWKKKEALQTAQLAVKKYPDTPGALKCKNLIEQIKSNSLSLKMEEHTPENQPVPLYVSYKNLNKIRMFVYRIDWKQKEKIQNTYDRLSKRYLIEQQDLVKKYTFELTNPNDYQPHSTEKIVEALPNGYYVVLVKSLNDDQWGYTFWQVTDVSLQAVSQADNQNIYRVTNRNNGKSIAGAQIKIYKNNINEDWALKTKKITDKNGDFNLSIPHKNYNSYLFEITYDQNKKAYFSDYVLNIHPYKNPKSYQTVFVFTDRSIYRPGQTVYFKAIALTKHNNRSEVLADTYLQITLYDTNRQKIKELDLVTNHYGSVSGEFELPAQTLTGNFSLSVVNKTKNIYANKNIKVEAYKRPKFAVDFKKTDQTYKINDTVAVTGFAKSFAGSLITGAKVSYRVKRKVQTPRWWYWSRPSISSEAQEIAHGQLTSDKKGEFIIKFKALPDLSVSPEQRPVFHYEIFAEVTDLNGETHTATTTVNVAYHAMLARIDIPEIVIKGKKESIQVQTTNLNGVDIPAQGQIKIYKLQAPDRVLRQRPWKSPEIQNIPKSEFIRLFPHLPYDQTENDYRFWKKGNEILHIDFDTSKQTRLEFNPDNNWQEGKYVAELTTHDKDGKPVTDKTYFDVKKSQPKQVPDQKYFDIFTDKDSYQPGENVLIYIGSAAQNTYIRLWIEKNHRIVSQRLIKTNGKYHQIHVPVTEKDRGGFIIHYLYEAYNDYVVGQKTVQVPYPSKELQIETLTFRDKLHPGQKEEWQFKIKGQQGQKIAAEVLASMYDASLDEFVTNTWHFNPVRYLYYRSNTVIKTVNSYGNKSFAVQNIKPHAYYPVTLSFEHLKWFDLDMREHILYSMGLEVKKVSEEALHGKVVGVQMAADEVENGGIVIRGAQSASSDKALYVVDGVLIEDGSIDIDKLNTKNLKIKVLTGAQATALYGAKARNGVIIITTPEGKGLAGLQTTEKLQINARKNLQETAFFFPKLYTDKNGNITFGFTIPETLTRWKLQLLAHTRNLDYAYRELFAVTQKDLMLFPNAPRFVREGDKLILSTKITNLTDKNLHGTVRLELVDAVSQKDISRQLIPNKLQQSFNIDANGNTQVGWTINIPENIEALQYKVMAKAGNQTDAEQNLMPVLSNRMLVTETLPMWVRGNQSKTFVLDKLLHNKSQTLKNHRLTLEITSNPAWYAVQALPYLMEYPYECSEQTFARFYANSLASHIANQNPKIKRVFDTWKKLDSNELLSALQKNQELKSLIIEETPWLRDAQNESEQKKRIALLFDLNKMSYEQNLALQKLKQMQLSDGGFTWFKGGHYSSRYITQHIVAGMGHLKHLQVSVNQQQSASMLRKAIRYIDQKIVEDYQKLQKYAKHHKDPKQYLNSYHTGEFQIHYLYARSFFSEKMTPQTREAADYYLKQAQKYWLNYRLYTKGLLALVSYRNGNKQIANDIIRSLDENSIKNDELGMYWKNNTPGLYWYEAPIETQALLIEAFDEIEKDPKKTDEMRIWLLKNKQTNAWKTTKQTTEAIYALLLRGTDWLSIDNSLSVQIGNIKIEPDQIPEIKTEAGTGYFKKSWTANEIKSEMAKVTITKKDKGIAWGGLYWQYFEDLDKISRAQTPVAITKNLFIRQFTDTGEKMNEIIPGTIIKKGDLIRVRITIKVDRDMEYVHLKDMRAAGFEPVNVLSGYRWQDGLGYYESTRDASTNFFISRLHKGVYVFEYDLRANNAGSFSNGITTLQCMYAPEFSSHSKGTHVNIE